MKVQFVGGLLACTLAFAGQDAAAQTDSRVFVAAGGTELVAGSLAQAMIAVDMCGVGDAGPLKAVVAAIDRRFRFCAGGDPAWSALLGKFAEKERLARAEGASKSFGTFAVEAFLRTRGAEAKEQGAAAYCATLPWKMMLDPASRTPEALAAYKKAHPGGDLDKGFAWFDWVLGLGRDTAWVEKPCNKDFWPLFPGTGKR